MMRILSSILLILMIVMSAVGCTTSSPKSEVTTSNITPSVVPTLTPTVKPTPEPTPTPEPIKIIFPAILGINDSLYFGAKKEDIIKLFGTPDEAEDSMELPSVLKRYDTISYNGKSIGKYKDIIITFQFFKFNGKYTQNDFGLSKVSFCWKSKYANCYEFIEYIEPEIVKSYGSPTDIDYLDGHKKAWVLSEDISKVSYHTEVGDGEYKDKTGTYNMGEVLLDFQPPTSFEDEAQKAEDAAFYRSGDRGVTLNNYQMIQEGMSLKKIEYYLGDGKKTGNEQKIGGSTYTYYEWYSAEVGTINIQFKDGISTIITKTAP